MKMKRYEPIFEKTAKLKEQMADPTMDDSGSMDAGMDSDFGSDNLNWDDEEQSRPEEGMFESCKSSKGKKKGFYEQEEGEPAEEEEDKEKEDMKEHIRKLTRHIKALDQKLKEAEDSKSEDESKESDKEEKSEKESPVKDKEEKKEESVFTDRYKSLFENRTGKPGLL